MYLSLFGRATTRKAIGRNGLLIKNIAMSTGHRFNKKPKHYYAESKITLK